MTGTMKFRFVLALVAGAILCASSAWADPPSQVGRLSLISGSVSFQPGNLDEWAPATLNYPLSEGDHLWTDAGARAEVQLFSSAIRLNSNTEFSFLNLDDETVQVRLTQGSLNISVRALDEGTAFEIDTPNATVSVLAAGSYRVDVGPTGDTSVTVRSGDTEVTAGENAYDVPGGPIDGHFRHRFGRLLRHGCAGPRRVGRLVHGKGSTGGGRRVQPVRRA